MAFGLIANRGPGLSGFAAARGLTAFRLGLSLFQFALVKRELSRELSDSLFELNERALLI